MDQDLRDQLQRSLGAAYTIERELGGGGMSRVYLATETAIDRQVVIKTLPPELAAGVNADRFRREIQLAGRLQHPHIVPILTSGIADGVPYYTMQMVEGESLRARLARAGELSVPDTIRLLREVVDALAYAHSHGVIHRDVKPDNILISGQHAVVTDFGVAKAISESAGTRSSLTSLGVALGTPAYMAPEQAAADPNVDSRADLYAVGAMAYEMLTGQPPFGGRSPQATLAAHLSEAPEPVSKRRPNVPSALAALVASLLEKRPADRPQTAEDVLNALDALMTPATGTTPGMPAATGEIQRNVSTTRAVAIYLGATMLAVMLAWLAARFVGLPMWIVPGVLVVMALGAPVIALSAIAHSVPTPVPTPTGGSVPTAARLASVARPWLTWRRVTIGGVATLGAFLLFVGAFMALRSLGIGPSRSLMAAGVLKGDDRLLVLDFKSPAIDTTLGPVLSDAFRTDLEQSKVVSVMSRPAVKDALTRMKRPTTTRVDLDLGREIAAREGVSAIVDGEIAAVGSTFIVSAQLVSASSGEVVAAYRETADNANALVPAIDRLSRQFRGKIGESLRSVNATPALARVSTSSLDALRKYTQALRAAEDDNNETRSVSLLREAVALDPTFAMAWRKIGVYLGNMGGQPSAEYLASRRAFELSDRLPEQERYTAIGGYYLGGPSFDRDKAIQAFEALLALDPQNDIALTDLGRLYEDAGDLKRAEEMYARQMVISPDYIDGYWQLAGIRYWMGDRSWAKKMADSLEKRDSSAFDVFELRLEVLANEGRYDSAMVFAEKIVAQGASNPSSGYVGNLDAAALLAVRGKVHESMRRVSAAGLADARRGNPYAQLDAAINNAWREIWFFGRRAQALTAMEAAAAQAKLVSAHPLDRRYLERAQVYAAAGKADRARALLNEWAATVPEGQRGIPAVASLAVGIVALAEGHSDSAISSLRRANEQTSYHVFIDPYLAQAYDAAGKTDSAIAVYERVIANPIMWRVSPMDERFLGPTYKRLGELYDGKGEREKALSNYGKFVALWKEADPELQVQVTQVRKRMGELAKKKG